jgi:hypothetical protein
MPGPEMKIVAFSQQENDDELAQQAGIGNFYSLGNKEDYQAFITSISQQKTKPVVLFDPDPDRGHAFALDFLGVGAKVTYCNNFADLKKLPISEIDPAAVFINIHGLSPEELADLVQQLK